MNSEAKLFQERKTIMDNKNIENNVNLIKSVEAEITKHIIGQDKLVRDTIIALFAGGNILLEGVPGLGKTKLVSTLSKTLGLDFKRIQFTPDLMPADITGTNIYMKDKNAFEFQKGPVFTNILLADEINRATPKTQAAMLEAMQEKSVSAAGETYKLDEPYMVLATQNPIEQEGTYPLPEAQLDRFMFKLYVEFPDMASLSKIVDLTTGITEEEVKTVISKEDMLSVMKASKEVPIAKPVMEYAMKLIIATHPNSEFATDMVNNYVEMGSSPRGAQNLIKAARVRALTEGRYNVSFDDINYIAPLVLTHRICLNYNAITSNITEKDIINNIIERLKVND